MYLEYTTSAWLLWLERDILELEKVQRHKWLRCFLLLVMYSKPMVVYENKPI